MYLLPKRPVRSLTYACLFSAAVVYSTASAEEVKEPTTLIITANRFATPAPSVGSAVTVLTRERIEEQKINSVSEALRGLAGVSVVQSGHRGGVSSVFMRGAEADQVLVLLDGVRLNESTTGGFDFSDLSIDNIERIEVLRGPQGVLYGSEAVGGVIQIFTNKNVQKPRVALGLEGGSFGTHRERVSLASGSEKYSSSSELSWQETDGISAAAKNRGNPERDGFDLFTATSSNVLRPHEDFEVFGDARYQRSHTDIDGFDFVEGAIDDLNYRQQRERLSLSTGFRGTLAERVKPSVQLAYVDEQLRGTDPDTEFHPFAIDSELLSVTSQADTELSEEAVLTLGHAYEHRQGENRGSFDEQRDVNALFAQQLVLLGPVHVSVGARHEWDSGFGEETTYRLTTALPLEASGTRVHSSYGTGYKAPSFNELAFPNFGNPDLRPETSWGFDFGVEQRFAEWLLADVTYFFSRYKDLIGFDTETFIAANIDRAQAQGVELSVSVTPCAMIAIDGSYTYTDSENRETGGILARRPRHQASVVARLYPHEQWDSTVRLLLVQSRRDSDGARMDNYATVDATLRYALNEKLKPWLRLENLFDEDYEELPGFGTPGFSVFAGIDMEIF